MSDSAELLDTWVRHSRTNSLQKIEDLYYDVYETAPGSGVFDSTLTSHTFEIEPMCEIDSIIGDSSIFLSGYYYHFTGKYGSGLSFGVTDSENFWYPIDPNIEFPQMAYSIYVRDSTIADRYPFTCDSLNLLFDSTAYLNEVQGSNNLDWVLYPNPSNTSIHVSFNKDTYINAIVLTDVSGKEVNRTYCTGAKNYTIEVSQFENGLYFVNLVDINGNFLESKKLIKQ